MNDKWWEVEEKGETPRSGYSVEKDPFPFFMTVSLIIGVLVWIGIQFGE